jgi:hypothetical protein
VNSRDKLLCAAIAIVIVMGGCGGTRQRQITKEELERRTQELMDSVAMGDQTPWKNYLAEDCMYFNERGHNMNKAALLKDLQPLPAGYSGRIKIGKGQIRLSGDTAILSYDMEETETIYGQEVRAWYHATDTWLRRNGEWQIAAGQVLRYPADPAPGKVDAKKYHEYVGTYELAPGKKLLVSLEGQNLYAERDDRPKELLLPEAPDIFFRKGMEGRRLFRRGDDGKVDALIDRRDNEDLVWKKTQ